MQFVEFNFEHADVVCVFISLIFQLLYFASKLVLRLALLLTIHRRRRNSWWDNSDWCLYHCLQGRLRLLCNVLQSVLAMTFLHCFHEHLGLQVLLVNRRNVLAVHRFRRGATLFFYFDGFIVGRFGRAHVFGVNWILWCNCLLLRLARVYVPLLLARLGSWHTLARFFQIFNVDQLVDSVLILIFIYRHFVVFLIIWLNLVSSLILLMNL